jgi:methylenetetrahydrofolate--tRNA-(uracil-5-)-methyltransferase
MNVNFGLFPPIVAPKVDADGRRYKGTEKTQAKKRAMAARARVDLAAWNAAETGGTAD